MKNKHIILENRTAWIDAYRGIGILLVILGHCGSPFEKFIYGFHMPMFFVLSGYLFRPRRKGIDYALEEAKKYIFPYFILCFINLVLQMCIEVYRGVGFANITTYIIGILYSRGTIQNMPNCTPLWFLTALYVALMIWNCLDTHLKPKFKLFSVISLAGLSYLLYVNDVPKLFWNIDTAMMAALFIGLGCGIRRNQLLDKLCGMRNLMIIAVLTLCFVVSFLAIKYNNIDHVNLDDSIYGNILLVIMGACPIVLGMMLLCKKTFETRQSHLLQFFGQHTLFVMGFDYFSGYIIAAILSRVGLYNWLALFVCKTGFLAFGMVVWFAAIRKLPNDKLRRMLML